MYINVRTLIDFACYCINLQNSFLFIILNHFPEQNGFYKRVSGLLYNSNKSYLSTSCINSIHNVTILFVNTVSAGFDSFDTLKIKDLTLLIKLDKFMKLEFTPKGAGQDQDHDFEIRWLVTWTQRTHFHNYDCKQTSVT